MEKLQLSNTNLHAIVDSIDHINGDRLDNRQSNLRYVTRKQNKANGKVYVTNVVGIKGVRRNYNRWVTRITKDNKTYQVGTFATKEEAGIAYNYAAKELFGIYARMNDV